MSIDTCKRCGDFVDTDSDTDCYDNAENACLCGVCREEREEIDATQDAWTALSASKNILRAAEYQPGIITQNRDWLIEAMRNIRQALRAQH